MTIDICTGFLKEEIKKTGGTHARTLAMNATCTMFNRGVFCGALEMLRAGLKLWGSDFITLQCASGTGMMYEPIHPIDWCEAMLEDPAEPFGGYSEELYEVYFHQPASQARMWKAVEAVEASLGFELSGHRVIGQSGAEHFHNEVHAMLMKYGLRLAPCPWQAVHR